MASTYTLISSNVLGASAASVTFSSIPQTYTDLTILCSVRTDDAATTSNLDVRFNGSTSSYNSVVLRTTNNTITSINQSLGYLRSYWINASSSTGITFSNCELYIPNYTSSQNKASSIVSMFEQSAAGSYFGMNGSLWQNTAAINSITLYANLGGLNFVSGSSFYLYGIKNS